MPQDQNPKQEEPSLGGLAKRWLKTQLRFHGDPHRGVRDRQEAQQLEQEMREKVSDDVSRTVFNAVMPTSWKQKLEDIERRTEEGKAERARQARAELEGRERAAVRLVMSGDVSGSFEGALPVTVERPEEAGESLTVELEPLDPIVLGGRSFLSFNFAIPAYHGPGHYDLSAIAQGDKGDDIDYSLFTLALDQDDEPFYWTPDYGPGTIDVGADGRTLRVKVAMEDAGSARISVDAAVELP
ncbi:MAG TPA: hypothetical protein VFL82_08620 [Thermomicrobiales bacterium]|nr:hypothetical protein [Thermomicrobiales bacterium]